MKVTLVQSKIQYYKKKKKKERKKESEGAGSGSRGVKINNILKKLYSYPKPQKNLQPISG